MSLKPCRFSQGYEKLRGKVKYVKQNYNYSEVLRTLARILASFEIRYIDFTITEETITEALETELKGVGTCLG